MVVRRRAAYFKRAEAFQDGDDPYHGSNVLEEIRTTDVRGSDFRQLLRRNRTSRVQEGIRTTTAPLRKVSPELQVNAVNGRRQSAAVTYLRPAMQRPNLTFRFAPM